MKRLPVPVAVAAVDWMPQMQGVAGGPRSNLMGGGGPGESLKGARDGGGGRGKGEVGRGSSVVVNWSLLCGLS